MLEYYEKYKQCPLVDTNSKLDAPMETPIKLTLGEIGAAIGSFLLLLVINTNGYFLLTRVFEMSEHANFYKVINLLGC